MFSVTHILTSTVFLLLIMGIRFAFGKYMSKRLLYGLWLLAAVKFLVPVPVANGLNVMNLVTKLEMDAGRNVRDDLMEKVSGENSGQGKREGNSDSKNLLKNSAERNVASDAETSLEQGQNTGRNSGSLKSAGAASGKMFSENKTTISEGEKSATEKTSAGEAVKNVKKKSDSEGRGISGFMDIVFLLRVLWFGGMLLFAFVLVINNIRFARRLRSSREFLEIYMGKLPVYAAEGIGSPCLFGIFSPAVYLPENLKVSEEYRKYILLHEWTHYKHLDMIWSLIRCICLAVWWFHPLVWIAFFMSVRDSELACDEGVLLTVGEKERKAYGYMLLELCKDSSGRRFATIPTLAAEMMGGKGEMRDRIALITRKAHHSMLLAVCAVILAVLACGCTFGRESVETGNMALAEEKNGSALEQEEKESYYTTYTEEEIRKDVEKQIGVLGKNSSKWLLQTELDAKDNPLRDDKRGIVRMETMSPRVYDKYTVSDLDQNGRLELISYDTDTRQVQIFEINEKTGVWHYHLLNCDMYKKGDTLSITKDTEAGGGNYYHGMAPAYCHVSWFQKTCLDYAEKYEGERVYRYYTGEELEQIMEISADEFMLRRTADEGIDYEKIYTDYVKSLWEKDKKMKYAAIVNSVQPVLLVTDFVIGETVSSGRDGANASDAEVYGYDREKNEVVSIGHINSTGSGYPVLSDGIWLEVGAHHGSERIFVDDGKGYHEMLVGYGGLDPEEHPTAEYDKICPFNEGIEGDKEKIPYYMADMLDLYRWGEEDTETVNSTGTPVQFTQIKSDTVLTSPFYGNYLGDFYIEVYRESFRTDRKKLFFGNSPDKAGGQSFPKTFSLSPVDYNEDGNLDFALGTYVSSNYYEYRFYSVSEDGRITELLDENGNAADIISGHLGVSPEFKYQNKTISYESYDQEKGKYITKILRLK